MEPNVIFKATVRFATSVMFVEEDVKRLRDRALTNGTSLMKEMRKEVQRLANSGCLKSLICDTPEGVQMLGITAITPSLVRLLDDREEELS